MASQLEAFGATTSSLDDVLAYFDELPPVQVEEMIGDWDGAVVPTGRPGEAQLDALRWVGKRFNGPDDVDPLMCLDDNGDRVASDVMKRASLRMVEFRDVVTATMVYDRHPIFDHFRRVDDDTVLGVMDRRGSVEMVFSLTRRAAPA